MTMLHRFATGVLCACVLALPALAQNDPMSGYYGNTMLMKNDAGLDLHVWFYPGGRMLSFSRAMRNGEYVISGSETTYVVQGDRLCRIDSAANPPTNSCVLSPINPGELGRKVGDKWESVGRSGVPEHFELVAGHR